MCVYVQYSSIITSHTRGTPCMVSRMFSCVKFKKLLCVLLFPQDETCHFPRRDMSLPEMTRGICSKCVITRDVAVEVPTSWCSMRISVGM